MTKCNGEYKLQNTDKKDRAILKRRIIPVIITSSMRKGKKAIIGRGGLSF